MRLQRQTDSTKQIFVTRVVAYRIEDESVADKTQAFRTFGASAIDLLKSSIADLSHSCSRACPRAAYASASRSSSSRTFCAAAKLFAFSSAKVLIFYVCFAFQKIPRRPLCFYTRRFQQATRASACRIVSLIIFIAAYFRLK